MITNTSRNANESTQRHQFNMIEEAVAFLFLKHHHRATRSLHIFFQI